MAIVAETKDWTWVLREPCPECGFDAADVDRHDLAPRLRAIAARWRELLRRPGSSVRPHEDRWSTLEYACHVRDVFRIMDGRLALLLAEDDPTFPFWDQDATAVEDRYGEQDPMTVATELETAGDVVAARLAAVRDGEWARPGRRSGDGARFTVQSLGTYLLHDPEHHVWDVTVGVEG